jgi:hypothetical protein
MTRNFPARSADASDFMLAFHASNNKNALKLGAE